MEIKIIGHNKERFEENLKNVLNVATLICLKGIIPTERDIATSETGGRWYIKEDGRYNLLPIANDYWANIKGEGENFIVIEFNVRYDGDGKKKLALTNSILAFFSEFVTINN